MKWIFIDMVKERRDLKLKKVSYLSKKLNNMFEYLKQFGIIVTIISYISRVYSYPTHDNLLARKIHDFKNKIILKYLKSQLQSKVKKGDSYSNNNIYNDCIWIAWLQGEDNAPEVIKLCINSIRRHANSHRVILITYDNLSDYIDIPEKIIEKHRNGKIGAAHFSDIIRVLLLAEYGGLWLDATTYVSSDIPQDIFKREFFSENYKNEKSVCVSKGKWIIGYMGGKKGSVYLQFLAELVIKYWTQYSICIDYFVTDYIVQLIYDEDTGFKKVVDCLENSAIKSGRLREICNMRYSQNEYNQIINCRRFHYLTYKYNYEKYTPSGESTLYGTLIENVLLSID